MRPRTYTIDQVAEDLASPFLIDMHAGSIAREVAGCEDLASRPRVRAALDALERAQNDVAIAAAIEASDRVAAWLAYSLAFSVLDWVDRLLVLAGARTEEQYFEGYAAVPTPWHEQWEAFVASRRAWEMRSC